MKPLVILPWLAVWVMSAGSLSSADQDAALEAALRKQTAKVSAYYGRDLARVGSWAAKLGLAKDAERIAAQVKDLAPESRELTVLERRLEKEEGPAPTDEAELSKLKEKLTKDLDRAKAAHAKRLFSFATQCMKLGLFTRAYDLIGEALIVDPDNKKARKILGYRWDSKRKEWVTQWSYQMRRKHFFTKEGWIPKKWKKRWEAGERNYNEQWVSIEEEQRIRTRNEYNPYRVESEHFEVSTNLGREIAWKYANLLEDFYAQFFRVFIGYYEQKAGVRLLFNRASNKRKHAVHFFPSHKKYLIHVKEAQGNSQLLLESAGFYSSGDRLSRFYWSENVESTLNTMYHEIAHQLFEETKANARGGSQANNWVIEGVAVYVESWDKVDGVWEPGRKTDIHEFQTAKRFLEGQASWNLASFVYLDNQQFHKFARGLNYALAGALVHFFMHFEEELYKEHFVRFLSDFYTGKVRKDSLVEMLPFPEELSVPERYALLAKQFREHVSGF